MKQQQFAMVNNDCWLSTHRTVTVTTWASVHVTIWGGALLFHHINYHSASVSYFALDYITMSYSLTLQSFLKAPSEVVIHNFDHEVAEYLNKFLH